MKKWALLYRAFYVVTIPFLFVAVPLAVLTDLLGEIEQTLHEQARAEAERFYKETT